MAESKDAKYYDRTNYSSKHIDSIRQRVKQAIAQRRLSITKAAKHARVSRPVMHGFIHNARYYPSTMVILRFLDFLDGTE